MPQWRCLPVHIYSCKCMFMHCYVFGASGFSGLELLELLAEERLPLGGSASDTYAGRAPAELRPGLTAPPFETAAALMARVQANDVVFLATPAEASAQLAPQALAK